MRCSRYGNGGRRHVIRTVRGSGFFKYLGSQVAADGGCEGMWHKE